MEDINDIEDIEQDQIRIACDIDCNGPIPIPGWIHPNLSSDRESPSLPSPNRESPRQKKRSFLDEDEHPDVIACETPQDEDEDSDGDFFDVTSPRPGVFSRVASAVMDIFR